MQRWDTHTRLMIPKVILKKNQDYEELHTLFTSRKFRKVLKISLYRAPNQ